MDRLNPDRSSSYGYPSVACDFETVKRELEMMVSSEVNVILTRSFDSIEIVRCNGTMSLPEKAIWPEGRLRFVLDEDGTAFEISEEEFTRAEHTPGSIWLEVEPFVLHVERRHGLEEPDPFFLQFPNDG